MEAIKITEQKESVVSVNITSKCHSLRKIVLPVKIGIDPMERLLVASFKGDPEFEMLEPQIFNDPVNGKGMRILRYRKDKKVDVYWQPGVNVDRSTITIGTGIGDFEETIIEPARYEITDRGVDIHFLFTDAQKRKVELIIIENTFESNRFSFLAPVGKDIDNPRRLFLANMLEFDLVRRKGTKVFAKIGDRMLFPETFPILRNLKMALNMRYSAKPVVGTFNPPMDSPLVFELLVPGIMEIDDMKVHINKESEITKICVGEKSSDVLVDFNPGFPNLLDLTNEKEEGGNWTYRISGHFITGGKYRLLRIGSIISIDIDVTEEWKPYDLPLSFRIFTWFVRSFRNWPGTYRWRGVIDVGNEFTIKGEWERKGILNDRLSNRNTRI